MGLNKNKQRLHDLTEQYCLRTGKQKSEVVEEVAEFVGCKANAVWLWYSPNHGWTSASKGKKIWEFFSSAEKPSHPEPTAVAEQPADYGPNDESEDIQALMGLASLLNQDPEVREHIVRQINLLSKAKFQSPAKSEQEAYFRTADTLRRFREFLTQESGILLQNEAQPAAPSADEQSQGDHDGKK